MGIRLKAFVSLTSNKSHDLIKLNISHKQLYSYEYPKFGALTCIH
ncbi:hypothetical protein VAEKB19_1740001 [Vibrio aestuarianus]|nr:hypothetical protein VAEKB19_1740001 [Vibrio aestuarianus]